jgi:hypothetical protein
MMRLLVAVLVVLMLPTPASGTLVVIVPSADGLVVAADSRTSVLGATCEMHDKITIPKRPKRTVIAVTGEVAFIQPPTARQSDVCGYMKSAPRMLDIASVVKRHLERKNIDLKKLALEEVGAECVGAVERFKELYPSALESYFGREVFSVVIASYDSKSKTAIVLNFVVRINPETHHAEAARFARLTMTPLSRRGVWSYGETDYLNQNVFGGVGRKFLTASTLTFILADAPIAEARQDQALAVAANVIEAASRTTQLVHSPSGIGGPIEIVLLGQKRRPIRIERKQQ